MILFQENPDAVCDCVILLMNSDFVPFVLMCECNYFVVGMSAEVIGPLVFGSLFITQVDVVNIHVLD